MEISKCKIEQVIQETLCFSFSEGDFLHRCLPKTYEYYGNMHLYKNHLGKEKDDFDDFLISEVPIFSFLCEKYYLEK